MLRHGAKRLICYLSLPVLALLISGCQPVKEKLGVVQKEEDAFNVHIEKKSLSIPPCMNLLPPADPSKVDPFPVECMRQESSEENKMSDAEKALVESFQQERK